jgi:SAM-dependent methyltransferase
LYLFLRENKLLFNSDKKIKLLHFAPEKFFFELFSANSNIEYYPCDLFPEIYNNSVIKMDITNITFEEGSFDAILCNHVLEHIPEDHVAMAELYRVLKHGGWGIFQVPIDYSREKTYEDFSITDPKEREKAFGQNDHVRWYGRDYKDRLAHAKFNVTEDDYVTRFSQEEIFKYGLFKWEFIYHCKKI